MKKFFQRHLPEPHRIHGHRHLSFLGERLHAPDLWHLNRRSAAGAVALGLFVCYLPIPFQMVVAAIGALFFRVNLPLSVVTVWVTNPLTIPPMFLLAYKLGGWLMGEHYHAPPEINGWQELKELFLVGWEPLLLGSLLLGSLLALAGYFTVSWLWRLHLLRRWNARKARRRRAAR